MYLLAEEVKHPYDVCKIGSFISSLGQSITPAIASGLSSVQCPPILKVCSHLDRTDQMLVIRRQACIYLFLAMTTFHTNC